MRPVQEIEVDGVEAEPVERRFEGAPRRRSPLSLFASFVVTHTDPGGNPLARIAWPISASLPYAAAVSTWR